MKKISSQVWICKIKYYVKGFKNFKINVYNNIQFNMNIFYNLFGIKVQWSLSFEYNYIVKVFLGNIL